MITVMVSSVTVRRSAFPPFEPMGRGLGFILWQHRFASDYSATYHPTGPIGKGGRMKGSRKCAEMRQKRVGGTVVGPLQLKSCRLDNRSYTENQLLGGRTTGFKSPGALPVLTLAVT